MAKSVTKLLLLATLLLLLGLPSYAQNTKGDRPQPRENRFRKGERPQKVKRSKQKKQPLSQGRGYRPSKKVNGSDRAARPVSPLRNTDPARSEKRSRAGALRRRGDSGPSERSKNVYGRRRLYVHNNAQDPDHDARPPISNKKVTARVKNLSARQRPNNVFPSEGRFVNNPSKVPRSHPRGETNRPQLARLKKLQGPDPRPAPKKRVKTRSISRSYTARRSINIVASYPRPKRKGEKAYTRDIAGRRLRTRDYESPRPALIPSQAGGRYGFRSRSKPPTYSEGPRFSSSGRKDPIRRRKVTPRSASSSRKIFETTGIFAKGGGTQPRPVERVDQDGVSKRRLRQQQSRRGRSGAGVQVTPRSDSRGFRAKKSPNMWARFPRPKKKGERPYLRDIAGKPLRTRDYETPPRAVIQPDYKPYFGRKRIGDRPYAGKSERYRSATRKPRAWSGDIAGRKIRGKKTPGGDRPTGILSKGYKSSRPGRGIREPLPAKQPGIGAVSIRNYRGQRRTLRGMSNQGEEYTGDIKRARRKYKAQGEEYPGNLRGMRRGFRDQGEEYSGSVKARRHPFRSQGEEFGGNLKGRHRYRNQGEESPGKLRRFYDQPGFHDQGEEFTGTLRTRRSPKGGGSVSGKSWNNQGQAVPTKSPRQFGYGNFSGSIKARRPIKGGGSVSGKLWNNRGQAIAVRPPGVEPPARFQGTLKTRHVKTNPQSISGKMWNNRGSAIAVRRPPKRASEAAGFPGKLRRFYDQPGFHDQGEEFTGSIKARRPLKGGGSVSGKIWNNEGRPIVGKTPAGDYRRIGTYQGNLKTIRPQKGGGSVSGKLWNNNENPLAVKTPSSEAGQAGEFSGNIRLSRFKRHYVKNPNASDEALKKTRPSRSVFDEGELQVRTRRDDYVRNSSSSKFAMKTREPGRAFGRSVDYQGNIKMQKFSLFQRNRELHPDSKFVKNNKNNVPQEKDALTNLKLWWARLFRKSDGQPDHLKEKNRRPRYDKGEQGLWYE